MRAGTRGSGSGPAARLERAASPYPLGYLSWAGSFSPQSH